MQNIKAVNEHQKALESLLDPLSTEHDVDVKYRLEILPKLSRIRSGIEKCNDHIKVLEKNATFIQKQLQLEVLEADRKKLEARSEG